MVVEETDEVYVQVMSYTAMEQTTKRWLLREVSNIEIYWLEPRLISEQKVSVTELPLTDGSLHCTSERANRCSSGTIR